MEYPELPQLNLLTNKVDVQIDVLRALVVHWVRRHVHGGDIVIEDHRCLADAASEFAEQLS
jgi:hypothetical protein